MEAAKRSIYPLFIVIFIDKAVFFFSGLLWNIAYAIWFIRIYDIIGRSKVSFAFNLFTFFLHLIIRDLCFPFGSPLKWVFLTLSFQYINAIIVIHILDRLANIKNYTKVENIFY